MEESNINQENIDQNSDQNTEKIQKISEAYESKNNTTESNSVITTTQWLVLILITTVPVLGIIFLLIWAFGDESNKTKKNWAKAQLIYWFLWILLTIPFFIFMFFSMASFFQ
jgi:4-amino-4-deoxy-L-arabinose transferase-like glycosyltransferase